MITYDAVSWKRILVKNWRNLNKVYSLANGILSMLIF